MSFFICTMVYRSTPRMEQHKQERKRHFLETAVRLFGKHGFAATTVARIVAESGMSTGSFYLYFRSKEEVFAAAMKNLGDQIDAAVDKAIARQHEPVVQMRAAVEALFLFLAENPSEARILIVESSGLSERLVRTVNALVRPAISLAAGISVMAMLMGVFAVLSLVLSSAGIYALMAYTVTQRTQEFGIRMALGAQPGDVRKLVIGDSLRLVAIAFAFGISMAFGLTRVMANRLLGMVSLELTPLIGIVPLVIASGVLASTSRPAAPSASIPWWRSGPDLFGLTLLRELGNTA